MSDTPELRTTPGSKSRPNRFELFEIASEQSGHFTAKQARASGYGWALLSHHAKGGQFIRVRWGLYRFRDYPSSTREHVIAAWLAVGKDKAIVSHESALDLLGLSDIVPNAVHLTVPRSMRGLPSMQGVTVHTSSKPKRPHDVVTRDGVVVTSATRSILDAAEAGAAPEQIEMAVAQAINRGLVIPSQLQRDSDERGRRVADLIAGAIRKAGL